jgi:osmotically-inducible protein OsmY
MQPRMRKMIILGALVALAGACRPAKNAAVGVEGSAKQGAEDTVKAVEKAPQKTDDVTISMAVKGKLADDDLTKASTIDVDTHDGVVYLKGKQVSEAAKARAEQLARQTDGVKQVVNEIVVTR